MRLELRTEAWPYATPFRITNYVFTDAEVLVARLADGERVGRGEAGGVYYRGETPAVMADQIEAVRGEIERGVDREALRSLLPAGGARNAVDAALWDLEAKRLGRPVWDLAGTPPPRPLRTTFTIGAGAPDEMARAAAGAYAGARAIKLKLTDEDPAACVRAVRAARPDVWLAVDANQGFTRAALEQLMPAMVEAGVAMVEQPFPVGCDGELDGLASPMPIAADESVQALDGLAGLVGRYDIVNIKLDKCGGLTEALAMAREARRLGLKLMVGCMSGTSLAIAPAFVLGQLCDFVDLDSPTFLGGDREVPAVYADGDLWCPDDLWGGP
ncbi:MAG TPA: dipeptide epimerase [Caulobacteraceae bacterium]|jgi:L-alanine-DL-glutamate epimerase-like enolase superfamily enzyme|nr:dipeptide epimerase [Caulobacteraceae bacterium]